MSEENNPINTVWLPIVTIISLTFGIVMSIRSCSKEKEGRWAIQSQIQERYYVCFSNTSWETGLAGQSAVKYQDLSSQFSLPSADRHPAFRCPIVLNDVADLAMDKSVINEEVRKYGDSFFPKYIDYLANEEGGEDFTDEYIRSVNYFYNNNIDVAFTFLELENVGGRICEEAKLSCKVYKVHPGDVYDLSMQNKILANLDFEIDLIDLGEIHPGKRVLVPLRSEFAFDALDAMPSVPIGICIVPESLSFVDKASGQVREIGIRGMLNDPQYIDSWIFGKG